MKWHKEELSKPNFYAFKKPTLKSFVANGGSHLPFRNPDRVCINHVWGCGETLPHVAGAHSSETSSQFILNQVNNSCKKDHNKQMWHEGGLSHWAGFKCLIAFRFSTRGTIMILKCFLLNLRNTLHKSCHEVLLWLTAELREWCCHLLYSAPHGNTYHCSLQPQGRGISRSQLSSSCVFIQDCNGAFQITMCSLVWMYIIQICIFCGLKDVLVHQKANVTLSLSLTEV